MNSLRVFLLDDEPVISQILTREIKSLEIDDLEITEVPEGTGKSAIEKLEELKAQGRQPGLFVIDLRLNNGLSGFDVIDRILELFDREASKIVILTGCWEGSDDWVQSLKYREDGKVDNVLGKWGLGQVLSGFRKILGELAT